MNCSRRTSTRMLAGCAGTVLAASLAACGSGDSGGTPKTYEVGAALPLSGSAVAVGQDFQRGIAAAAKELNDAGGINGVKVNVHYADNKLTGAGSVQVFNQLVSTHHVKSMIMTSSAGVTATAPLATKSKLLMLNPGGEDPTLQKLSPNLISNIPNVKTEVEVMLPYLKQQGHTRMAMYAEGDALGVTTASAVKAEWTKLGGTFLGSQLEPITVVDHSSVISKIKSLNPDVVYVLAGGQQAGNFIKQAREGGLNVQLAGASPLQSGDVLQIAGNAANGMLDSAVAPPLQASSAKASAYKTAFAALYPKDDPTNVYSIFGHDALMIYAASAKYLADHKMAYSGANLIKTIHQLSTFDVAGGTIKVDPDGSSVGTITLSKIQNGKFVPFQSTKPNS